MKGKLLTLAATVVTLVTLSACSSLLSGGKDITVDTTFNGKEVEAFVGRSLIVILESNPSTGFAWAVANSSDPSVLKEKGHMFQAPTPGTPPLVGVAGKDVWTFSILNKGKTTILMEYSQPWEGGMKRVKTFTLTVAVK